MSEPKDPGYLEFIVDHVFLPPKLPQEADEDHSNEDLALLCLVRDVAEIYQQGLIEPMKSQWEPIVQMLRTTWKLQISKSLPRKEVINAVMQMKTGDVLALHIEAQNAGLILRQISETQMIFESFEVSPSTASVIGTAGKLRCSYPGPAIAVNTDKAKDPAFLEEFTTFIQEMKSQVLEEAMPKSSKGGSEVLEERETAHPKFITELLTGILAAIGRPAEIERIQKRIADDVLWNSARLPWRRSPLWLIVRVALQTTLKSGTDTHPGAHTQYKAFMIYLMTKILGLTLNRGVSSDILFVMNAKLSRRVYKARDRTGVPEFVLREAVEMGKRVYETLDRRWEQIQKEHSKQLDWDPQSLSFDADVKLTLENSKEYLREAKNRQSSKPTTDAFKPREIQRIPPSGPIPQPCFSGISDLEKDIALADFELWILKSLDDWVTANLYREEACRQLEKCIEDYTSAAKTSYASNPERMSIMILTIMELWVALDNVAVEHHQLLRDYFPEFPENLLAPLLLPKVEQMNRLRLIEKYLEDRRAKAAPFSNPSIFSDAVTDQTFAVRYFKDSYTHRELERSIQAHAQRERDKKITEFRDKQREHEELLRTANSRSCDMWTHWEYGYTRHDRWCKKCDMISQAHRMRAEVHEWPLPENSLQRMVVVFELRCPLVFAIWREVTYKILVDICTPSESLPEQHREPEESLATYSILAQYSENPIRPRSQRLQWSSSTKSFLHSHYRDISLPSTTESIGVTNALQYALFDTTGKHWTKELLGRSNIIHVCSLKLPDGPYKKLQYTVESTSTKPNEVIAKQNECPIDLQLHEYLAFGMLRAGHRIQWLNIARELRSRTLTFNSEAVNLLLMQAAWQAGPRDDETGSVYRESHLDLQNIDFGNNLLSQLEDMLNSVKASWLEGITVQSLIALAARVLSLSQPDNGTVAQRAIDFLHEARKVTIDWTRELAHKLQEYKEADMREFQLRALQMAAICRQTYNVDEIYLGKVVRSDDIAILVECATIIHDNTPAVLHGLPLTMLALLDRDRRLSHAIENHVRSLINSRTEALDLRVVWHGYKPGTPWSSLPEPNNRWMVTHTAGGLESRSQEVHYNLISGQLLVEGLPLGRMPSEYISHQTYLELFGDRVFDVFLSELDGMKFQNKHHISDYEVCFAMRGGDLIIRTRTSASVIHEYIPRVKLRGDFPAHFVENHLHWLEIATGRIEFRDAVSPWVDKDQTWRIYDMNVLLIGKSQKLFDIRSQTASMITEVLSPLEHKEFIDIRYSPHQGPVLTSQGTFTPHVLINLPRLKLEFFINSNWGLECRQFPGMVVDIDNQDIGTMTGLKNRLVVRQGSVRSVIIPYGKVNYVRCDDLVTVHIDTTLNHQVKVKYYIYTLDRRLNRLVGNGSLASHLYKIYLHAVTAYCLPDTLTRRTGTEEALACLRAPTTWSFQTLKATGVEADLLRFIASLTPERVYYPPHLKVMQQVAWGSLSPVAQHDEFHTAVMSIFAHARRFHIFPLDGEDSTDTPEYYKTASKDQLMKRAATRNAYYRLEEFGGALAANPEDSTYSARDTSTTHGSMNGASVLYTASMVERWPTRMHVSRQLMDDFKAWGMLKGPIANFKLDFDQESVKRDLASVWCSLYNSFREITQQRHTYKLVFFLSVLAYSGKVDARLIETLLAFATVPAFRQLDLALPTYSSYSLGDGFRPNRDQLHEVVKSCATAFERSDEAKLSARYGEGDGDLAQRRHTTYNEHLVSQLASIVDHFTSQWPCSFPNRPSQNYTLVDISMAVEKVRPLFESWYRNKTFEEHVEKVQNTLNGVDSGTNTLPQPYSFIPSEKSRPIIPSTIQLKDLLGRDAPVLPNSPTTLGPGQISRNPLPAPLTAANEIDSLIQVFRSHSLSDFEGSYADGLKKSYLALQCADETVSTNDQTTSINDILVLFRAECEEYLKKIFDLILQSLEPTGRDCDLMFHRAGLWPRLSPISLLEQLATNRSTCLSMEWKKVLITYGKAITMVQRAERLLAHAPKAGEAPSSDFIKEAENMGHQNWDPLEQPDWLLIEIENNLLVRPVQAKIASEMISPTSGKNTVMQLNMGEGKTSVIVPIVAATLADGKKLVRVIVLKPLAKQMFQMLVLKLGSLTNRRIFYMPFSRSVKMTSAGASQIQELYQECMKSGGILLTQPEHMLSFKLIGLEWLHHKTNPKINQDSGAGETEDTDTAKVLLETQNWLEKKSRDILDESDEVLNVRHELIYTIGTSEPIEHSPDRWVIVQEIFDLIRQHLSGSEASVQTIEVDNAAYPGCFPSTRILDLDAGKALLKNIASRVVKGELRSVSFRLFPEDKRQLAEKFITDPSLSEGESKPLLDYCEGKDNSSHSSSRSLFLLRGLIAHNTLLFSLKDKRWRVDYGLDLKRSMLAVPYRAKDLPAAKAEFSHPDVAIILTCLSYYYGGLTEDQLKICFRDLYKSDNPTMEYEQWLRGVDVPDTTFNHLNGINTQDKEQWQKHIFPMFRFNKSVIDFYLSGVVFPKQAKEFRHKLSTSSWDIAEETSHPTTGFSGTNDNQFLLPLSITQRDLPEQLSTNARVLHNLLRPENRYRYAGEPGGERFSDEKLLKFVAENEHQPPIRVLLDVGAQLLKLRNSEVVKEWLKLVPEAQAAVFFDETHELLVMTRDHSKEPFIVSAFAKQLDKCLVYLDEAHTRGTDLKLPIGSRAAVTLGPKLTKDRLVQACMRMRRLGDGHSVLFCGPPEIHRKILDLPRNTTSGSGSIGVMDVLHWSMVETCTSTRELLPIWAKQGACYQRRSIAWENIRRSGLFSPELLEKEARKLHEHYGFERSEDDLFDVPSSTLSPRHNELSQIREKCRTFGIKSLHGAHMLEEQERELSREIQIEREPQRPPPLTASNHRRCDAVEQFIKTGTIKSNSTDFIPVFDLFLQTSAKENLERGTWSTKVLSTFDFSETVQRRQNDLTDDFLKPVNWVISSRMEPVMVILSPYEINEFIPEIRKSRSVFLHIYSPKVSEATQSFENLTFLTIPSLPETWLPNTSLMDQVNIFAGQLYFRDFDTYARVCGFLGLYLKQLPSGSTVSIYGDGFVRPSDRQELNMADSPFTKSPVPFLQSLLGLRRKGQSYLATHMGQILHGQLLKQSDFKQEQNQPY